MIFCKSLTIDQRDGFMDQYRDVTEFFAIGNTLRVTGATRLDGVVRTKTFKTYDLKLVSMEF